MAPTPSEKPQHGLTISGSISLVMLAAAIGQITTVVWQASQIQSTVSAHEARIDHLETSGEALARDMAGRGERLAQILARLDATVEQLGQSIQRLDRRMEAGPR
jgi:ABC-type transporter Mla subunit MlaD